MKRALLLLLGSVFVGLSSLAQQAPAPPQTKLEDLRTPPSPAFVLMGVAPTTVERPTTPRAVGAAFLNAVEEADGTLPDNFSLEVAPYWLTPRPTVTFDQVDRAGFWKGLLQTFSASLASKGADTASEDASSQAAASEGTLLGVGTRASWMIGKRSALAQQTIDAYRAKAVEILLLRPLPPAGNPTPPPLTAAEQEALRPFLNAIRDSLRQGRWVVEAAAAMTGRFPDNETSRGHTEKAAIWITPTYRFVRSTFDKSSGKLTSAPTVDFIAVARYIHDRTATTDGDGVDLGGRLLWDNTTFALSAEFVQRTNIDNPTHRFTALLEYKISDDLYLSGSFGKDFDDSSADTGDLQAILGINWNLGAKPNLIGPPLR
jgi:hypothetical protein